MEHRDCIVLKKILDELDVASTLLGQATFEQFSENEMQKRAICMTVINVGELVKNLSETCCRDHKGIPWKAIAGFRDIAAHKYQTLRKEDVYETVVTDFPFLKGKIEGILV